MPQAAGVKRRLRRRSDTHLHRANADRIGPYLEIAAEKLKDRYVLSWKPNASQMIATFDEGFIQQTMEKAVDIARDCCLVISLRDTQTLFGEPERITAWTRITLEAVMKY